MSKTRLVWIDETYLEYSREGAGGSFESLAAANPNVMVCKSMSKVYALSGLRVAYLVSHPDRVAALGERQAPWAVSLPAQVCGALALQANGYYKERYVETARLRAQLSNSLRDLRFDVLEGEINAVLVHLPQELNASAVCSDLALHGVYVRDAASMGATMVQGNALRISVRNAAENCRCVAELERCLAGF